jgi:hypothetical protein
LLLVLPTRRARKVCSKAAVFSPIGAGWCKNGWRQHFPRLPMPSEGTRKRISRIMRRADPSVREALQNGQISARKADQLLYLEPAEQRDAIARILAKREALARRSKLAAAVIKAHVAAGRRDLASLRRDLQLALASPAA